MDQELDSNQSTIKVAVSENQTNHLLTSNTPLNDITFDQGEKMKRMGSNINLNSYLNIENMSDVNKN